MEIHSMLVLTTIFVGLMAGLFFSYSVSVVLGLNRVTDLEYISVFRSINRAIQNPVFFVVFFGALLLSPITTFLVYKQSTGMKLMLVALAAALYVAGVFGVTVLGSVPLNNSLDMFNLAEKSIDDIADLRRQFERKWNALNLIRTLSSLAAFVLLTIACVTDGKSTN